MPSTFKPNHTGILSLPSRVCYRWKLSGDKDIIDIANKNNTEIEVFIPAMQASLSKSTMNCAIESNGSVYTIPLKYIKDRREL